MRQFILAKEFLGEVDVNTMINTGEADSVSSGSVGVAYVNAEKSHKCANIVLATEAAPILFPFYDKDLTMSLMQYEAAATFTAQFTVGEVSPYLDYTATFIKKGKQFNERNKWSAVIHAKATDTAETIAAAIAKFVNDNPTLGLTATAEGAAVTVLAKKEGEDYTITFADELYGTQLAEVTQGKPAQGDAAHIKDLFEKCVADRGFEYTGEDLELYPGYTPHIEEGEYSVLTLRFTEPRLVGTREEAVYQIVQVAGEYEVVKALHDYLAGVEEEVEETVEE